MERWQCMSCGYIEEGDAPPDECPICGAPWAAFERLPRNQEAAAVEMESERPAGYRYVIVGNSSAGRSAARAMQKIDPDGDITVLSEEQHPFYYRPILPDFIGGFSEERVFRSAQGVYADGGLKVLLDERVVKIDTARKFVQCASNLEIPYDALLLATGSAPVMVPWPGSEAEGIAYFRTFADAQRIAALAGRASRAVVVGGGLLGLEFVRAFLARKLQITLLVRESWVGNPALDSVAGQIIQDVLTQLGVSVTVRLERHGDEAVVSVIDQGIGIPKEEIPRLFQRFYQTREGKRSGGLGLGLYITRLIVQGHGGRIWVESQIGKGSTFSFSLPLATAP